MVDMLDTRHHILRRKLGVNHFSGVKGYEKATSRIKYISEIEEMVNNCLKKNMKFSFLVLKLGRKELEELIMTEYKPKYNSASKRGNRKSK